MAIGEALKDRSGVSAVEYGLLLALIALGIVVAVAVVGGSVNDVFVIAGESLDVGSNGDQPAQPGGPGKPGFPDPCEKGGKNCGQFPGGESP